MQKLPLRGRDGGGGEAGLEWRSGRGERGNKNHAEVTAWEHLQGAASEGESSPPPARPEGASKWEGGEAMTQREGGAVASMGGSNVGVGSAEERRL